MQRIEVEGFQVIKIQGLILLLHHRHQVAFGLLAEGSLEGHSCPTAAVSLLSVLYGYLMHPRASQCHRPM